MTGGVNISVESIFTTMPEQHTRDMTVDGKSEMIHDRAILNMLFK